MGVSRETHLIKNSTSSSTGGEEAGDAVTVAPGGVWEDRASGTSLPVIAMGTVAGRAEQTSDTPRSGEVLKDGVRSR